jgi:hypothetical protein
MGFPAEHPFGAALAGMPTERPFSIRRFKHDRVDITPAQLESARCFLAAST